ncbi:NADH dehydrogenase subunit H [Magnetococcus marinus MC-1]|uniref:NADH-quinone oxidoreductase subunit H n=1 Tax=Magnetococcus marinus (strain ATCC BAA-1437 / JCM 17883 / MC-1) TaxID=156889 RepID=NUOH_MAGMM|nr:NADH-quinone oxidoreductase subunit NuoH [Magnetococcus marinus]A0LDS0.1 RecName: Full=NADH-quinone oxidoreductase subunit H; AltName: Full=NADH dehydrogenase I subunit H; AltName: Full=NDH-1 subunit H [Magnetococcus marinus MC-1]ABK46113.1 NADH dehydrogenase subunit H [Magnetococcus marinus MC-1]
MAEFISSIQAMGVAYLGETLWTLVWTILKIAVLIAPILFCVTYLTLAERRLIGFMQVRLGPNRVGVFGILQPLADAVKLFVKETMLPAKAHRTMFILAPILTFSTALVSWAVVPFSPELVLADVNVGVLFILAMSSLGAYGVLLSGWASNTRYSLLGGLRSAAQMISYEVSMGFTLVPVIMLSGSLNLGDIVESQKGLWYALPLLPGFFIYFISVVAETNRAPFDLPEAEAELVSGFCTEYSAMTYGMFFLGEYANIIMVSVLGSLMFLGGWLPPIEALSFIPGIVWLILKTGVLIFFFLWLRATFPRYRYDQLMRLGWKVFLPISLAWIFIVGLAMHLLDMA